MKFSLQSNYGDVWGRMPVPEVDPPSPLSPEEFASRLAQRLMDYPEVGRIDPLDYGDPEVSITWNPGERGRKDPQATIQVITEAVGITAIEHALPPLAK